MANQIPKRFADLTAALEDAAGLACDGQRSGLSHATIRTLLLEINALLKEASGHVLALQTLTAYDD